MNPEGASSSTFSWLWENKLEWGEGIRSTRHSWFELEVAIWEKFNWWIWATEKMNSYIGTLRLKLFNILCCYLELETWNLSSLLLQICIFKLYFNFTLPLYTRWSSCHFSAYFINDGDRLLKVFIFYWFMNHHQFVQCFNSFCFFNFLLVLLLLITWITRISFNGCLPFLYNPPSKGR